MKNLIDTIKLQTEIFEKEADIHLNKGVKAAGARARKAALEISKLMKDYRKKSIDMDKQKAGV